MTVESLDDIAGLRHIGRIVAQSLQTLEGAVRPGISTAELDTLAGELLQAAGARSAPYTTYRFPGNICVSINDEATHGIPGGRVVQKGQVITIEPHITTGKGRIYQAKDGWTLRTRDKGHVAQFEHTLVITQGRPLLLTAL